MAADKKISELPVASTLTGAEAFEVLQGGVNKQSTIDSVINNVPDDFVQSIVDSSGDTINLDFEGTVDGIFTGSHTFAVAREVIRSNESRALKFDFMFEVTDVSVPIDFGSDTRSWHAYFVDGVFTPADVGLYKAHGTRYGPGGLWMIDFNGVYSVGDAPPEPPDPGTSWILGTGIWNDSEYWDDSAIWKDAP